VTDDSAPAPEPVSEPATPSWPSSDIGSGTSAPVAQVYLLPGGVAGTAPPSVQVGDRRDNPRLGTDPTLSETGPVGDELPERDDWPWVQEWRAGQEPTPWATGGALAAFSALVVGVAVWVLSAGLSDRPIVAVLVNVLVAAGLAPAMWLSRGLPVLRWIAAGAAAGILAGWISAILMLPLPLP
jgi:hypothetical protein